ncbi:MAG: 3'-5' exonuclease domain-containing protein 2 [Bacteroidales bacterium]|nr:3'-5' exonuclease domain-containing protein 2 [Bacteroidales bacterium]
MFKLTVTQEEIEKLPMAGFGGKIQVISRPGLDYLRALAYLRSQTILGFDTETRPVFTPTARHNKVALLQLSGPDRAYLFRLNEMGLRKSLCKVLADASILKIGAASHDDVCSLQKRTPFEERGYVDLQKIAWQWGIRDKSVKKLAANILGIRISKTQQLSNWEADELSQAQKLYAATDAWVCREMYLKLLKTEKSPLSEEDRVPPEQRPKPVETPVCDCEAPVKPKRKRKRKRKNVKDISEKGA